MATKKAEQHKEHEPFQPFENATKLSLKEIMFNNFVGGLFWALGATIGLSILVYTLSVVVQNINFVPAVGSFASQVLDFILDHNPNLKPK